MVIVHSRAKRVGLWIFGLTMLASGATAGEAPAGTPLTLRQAVQSAMKDNPDLKGFAYSLRAQDARSKQAGLRPAPEFSAELENVAGSGAARGLDAAEATFSLSQVIELGGKRSARVSASLLSREVIGVEQQAAQLDVLAEVTRRFIHVAGDQAQLQLTKEATELARKTVSGVKRRVVAAKSPDVELYRANVELTRAEIELAHAEHELTASRAKLAAMWGKPDAQFGSIEADLYQLPEPAEFQNLVGRLEKNPDFVHFATEARSRDAEVRLAETRRRPDVQLTGGLRRLEETNDHAFVVGVSVPLFAGRQASPAIDEAVALRGQVDAEREAAFVKARAQLFELYQELRHAINETKVLQKEVLPQMAKALRETEYAYDRGRYSYIELVDGQRAYIEVQRALITAATNVHTFQAEIERLTGEPLVKTP